jgi:general stress protein 26
LVQDTPSNKREHLLEIIKSFSTAMLVSQDADGHLHARPMHVAECRDDGRIYFAASGPSGKVAELADHPLAAITFQGKLRFASLNGRVRIMDDRAMVDKLWSDAWKVWFPRGRSDPDLC